MKLRRKNIVTVLALLVIAATITIAIADTIFPSGVNAESRNRQPFEFLLKQIIDRVKRFM